MLRPFLDSCMRRWGPVVAVPALLVSVGPLRAQRMEGDLTIWVRDATGPALAARVVLTNRVAGFEAEAQCGAD